MVNVGINDVYNVLIKMQDNMIDMQKDIHNLDKKIEGVEERLNTKIDDVEKRLNTKIENVRAELTAKIENVRKELKTEVTNVRQELKADMKNMSKETSELVMEDVVPYFEKQYSKMNERVTNLENFAIRHGYAI